VDSVEESLAYYVALQKAGVPLKCTCTRKAVTPSPAEEQVADRAMAAVGGNMVGNIGMVDLALAR